MSTARVFDALWGRYDLWYARNPVLAENELRAVKALGLRGRGLEVGVGTGWFASRLGVEYGVDPSIGMLRVARERGVEAAQAVGEALPFRNGVFDYTLLIVTLCFVDDPVAVLREAARATKPGGAVAACIVPRESSWGRYYSGRRDSPFYRVARFYTTTELEEMMTGVGLRVAKWVATLRESRPTGPHVEEEPVEAREGGFVCAKAVKTA